MKLGEGLMKVIIKVTDVVALAKRFEASPGEAMRELMGGVRQEIQRTLERVMEAEIGLFLGKHTRRSNKRNGYTVRRVGIKGLGAIEVQVPRDRLGQFESKVIAPHRRYDVATEKDLALLHLAGLSTRMLSSISNHLLGIRVSAQEVSNSLATIVPAARRFLERSLHGRQFKYLYIDGTNFHIRRTTVAKEPTLVVIGVDEDDHKSILAMVQGDKDSRPAWEMVFAQLKTRGLDGATVKLGIMDGLPGLGSAFVEAFPNARVARCWVHKARNVFPLVPRRYQAEFKTGWDQVAYASGGDAAKKAFEALKVRWGTCCRDAILCLEKDLSALLVHYDFPREHWDALRTTNPIERVNKEFKRRSKSMETIGADGLKALLAFTALRLEFGWASIPISSASLSNLKYCREREEKRLQILTQGLLN